MARPIPENTLREKGTLEVLKNKQSGYNVVFTPPVEAMPRGCDNPENCKAEIARLHSDGKVFTFYPFKVWGLHTMESRYSTLETITVEIDYPLLAEPDISDIEEMIAGLPTVFIKDYNYGLGFLKEYRHIALFLETIKIKHLSIFKNVVTTFDRDQHALTFSERDFNSLRKSIDAITIRARKIASNTKLDIATEMILGFINKEETYQGSIKTKISNSITKSIILPLNEVSRQKQNEAIDIIRINSKKMLREQPQNLMKLRTDIDLVTLEELLYRFEEMIEKDLNESHWHRLFDANPFILNMAFGVPVIKVQSHASVGGRKISGGGDKISDFLVKNSLSNNAAIVEIKTPSAKLISTSSYRSEIYSPSTEISGAVNQILDQIHKFQKNIASLKEETRNFDIETYHVSGVLVIGRSLSNPDEQKSFDLFRGNSKNIHIVTFDELLEKLKQLKIFLNADDNCFTGEDDLPF